VFVAASTECWPEMELPEAIEVLQDLEFTTIEIDIHESGGHIKPSEVVEDPERAAKKCGWVTAWIFPASASKLRLPASNITTIFMTFAAWPKPPKSPTYLSPRRNWAHRLTRKSSTCKSWSQSLKPKVRESPYAANWVPERRPRYAHGALQQCPRLGISLDPSVYVAGPAKNKSLDKILKFVYNVHLRIRDRTSSK
jgi:hypothetical protein